MMNDMLRLLTAGESHGKALVGVLEGLPAGVPISPKEIAEELARRRHGHGRSGRQKLETDRFEILSGVRHGRTLGSPIALTIENAEWRRSPGVSPVTRLDWLGQNAPLPNPSRT